MAQITPKTVTFSADSRFLPGGSVIFGQTGIVPDAENPATLKSVYLDEAETQIAQNPQPLDSSAKFQQSPDGILYGTGEYSWIWFDASGVEVYRDLNISLQEDFGTAAFVDTGTASDEVPLNSDLGTASTRDTGTLSDQIPLNSDLADVLRDSDIGQTVAGLSSPGTTNWDSGTFLKPATGGGIVGIDVNTSANQNLPSGGTYFVMYQQITTSNNFLNPIVDILAGGSTISAPADRFFRGYAWKFEA